jgi:hypothetical protein
MPELEELRYPFSSAIEFFGGGYWRQFESLHLLFAWVCVLILSVMVLREHRATPQKLLALYFSLTLFNNYCFLISFTSLGDMMGIVTTLFLVQRVVSRPASGLRLSRVSGFILTCAAIFAIHALIIEALYPQLNESAAGLVRVLVIARVVSLGLCIVLFRNSFHKAADMDWLIIQVVNFGMVAIICYFVQIGILFTGHLPFGTFIDAGFIGVPSFGAVSVERGHFGKFLTPLFPFFLFAWLHHRRRLPFLFFSIVTLINFSASSLSYFACYVTLTAWIFRRQFLKFHVFFSTILALSALIAFVLSVKDVFGGVVSKVVSLGIEGDSSGGRSISILADYLRSFPLGISYGGSTLRIAPGLEQIEGGIYPFISQLSILSIPLIIFLLYLEIRLVRANTGISIPYLRELLAVGILALPFIFAADSLWFVPTIWLPLVLSEQISCLGEHTKEGVDKQSLLAEIG